MTEGSAPPPGPRRAALIFIFATVLLDVLALGVVIPVLPPLIQDFLGGDTARAAGVYGLFGTVWALMQFLCSPFLGALSDRYGRRPVILISCAGLGLDYFLMALAPGLGWLFAGRVISGMTAASFSTAWAYVADVTPPEKRSATFGLVGAAWGLGFVLGPALGGELGRFAPRLPFWVSGALALANALYGLFVLPESLPPDRRSPFSWARANPLGSLRLLGSHAGLLGLGLVYFLYQLAHQVLPSVFVLYAGHRYGWEPWTVGRVMALVGISGIIVQAGVVRQFVRRFGERSALLTGLFFGTAGFAVYGLAGSGGVFLVAVPIFAFMGLFNPAAQAIMTRRVGPREQGQLQGANASLAGIAGMAGPVLFSRTFAQAIGPWKSWGVPGAPFLLAGLLVAVAIPLAGWVTRGAGQTERVPDPPGGPGPEALSEERKKGAS
ncbi:MAG TPA: TCR/Tet family MFS transporter [Planctomycetota bacterium]|nr:TCR/Tet family MFS transporter [Planctomycetota bacterium]